MTTLEAAGPEGLLLVDKAPGPTSHDVIVRLRRLLGVRRIGHAGTLDPPASGLLPVLTGRATRLAPYLDDEPKRYAGRLQLGLRTDTDDTTGRPLYVHAGRLPSPEQVLEAAQRFVGTLRQAPPRYSARKIAGRRAYQWARRGEPREAAPRLVTIHRFELRPTADPALWEFEAEVSSGTYIRALARDLGERLGVGGTLAALRRLAVGPMRVEDALSLEGLDRESLAARIVPLEAVPLRTGTIRLEGPQVRRFLQGTEVAWDDAGAERFVRVLDAGGRLLGIARVGEGRLKPRVVVGS